MYKLNKLNPPFDQIANEYGIRTLERRRKLNDVSFLYKLLNFQIDCHEMISF
jgi:hypothetical protein